MNTQDFSRGNDFTGINPATGGDHNNLIDLASPNSDVTVDTGKGLILTTTDTAAGIPAVPDAATNTKWQRYIWNRRPFPSSIDKTIRSYAWNGDANSDPIYLRWLQISPDLTVLTANVNNALATSNNAVTIAQASNTTANTSIATANAASAAASAAQVSANTGIANAAGAQATANTAQLTANAASGVAAQNSSSIALGPIDSKVLTVSGGNTLGTTGQLLRVNAIADALEFFNLESNIAQFTETTAAGTDAGNTVALTGSDRRLNTTVLAASWAALNVASGVVTLQPGAYRIKASTIGYNIAFQIFLNINGATSFIGPSMFCGGASINVVSNVEGVVTSATAFTTNITLMPRTNQVGGLGKSVNLLGEVYSILTIIKLR